MMKQDWHEPELSRHLRPVEAPEQLWDRVQGASSSARVRAEKSQPGLWMSWRWATAALATVAVVAGITLWLNREVNIEEMAVQALSWTPEQMDFRSGDLAELRAWVKTGTGLELPFPGHPAASVHLVGAKNVTRKGVPTVEIAYRVGDSDARLVITKAAPDGDGRHRFKKSGSYHGASFHSWTMRGQLYTIASRSDATGVPSDAKVGCMLCHNTGAPRTSVN